MFNLMAIDLSNIDLFKVLGLAGGAFVSWILVNIKLSQRDNRIELIETIGEVKGEFTKSLDSLKDNVADSIAELKEDINEKHLENQTTIVAHVASDERHQESTATSLTRIDSLLTNSDRRLQAIENTVSRVDERTQVKK